MTRNRIGAIVVAGALAMALGACGATDDGGGDESSASASTASQNEQKIAKIDRQLSGNLYVKASDEAGKGTERCANTKGPDEKLRLAFSIEGLSHPFLVNQADAAKAAAKANNATLSVFSGDDDVAKQLSGVETALARGTDGLIMMPANTQGLQPVLDQYKQRGIPVFFATKGMESTAATSQVLAPYSLEGQKVGEFVVDHYKNEQGPIKVAVISGISGDLSSVARVGAFERELLKAGDKFEIVAEQPGEYRREPSQKAMEDILSANPDVQLVMGANDEAALGALSALTGAGKTDVDLVGVDGQTEMFKEIENGAALATFTHLPTAGKAVELAAKCLRGEPVPAFEVNPGELVTKQSIDSGAVKPAF